MTWIVGGITPVGQAFLIGDTRVTFSDEREADLVRKVHWIGRDMVAGFAGSVRIGFALLTDLAQKLRPDGLGDVIWKPEAVAKRWSTEAEALFQSFDECERNARCSILIAAVAPRNNGPFPFATLIEMKSPSFRPRILPRFGAIQIGSGSAHLVYRDWAERYFQDPRFMTNFASWAEGMGPVLAMSLSQKVAEDPTPGVSPFMHVVSCGRGSRSEARVPAIAVGQDEAAATFPLVANGYSTFLTMAKELGSEAAGAAA